MPRLIALKPFVRFQFDQKLFAIFIAVIGLGPGCQSEIDAESMPKFVVQVEQPVTKRVRALWRIGEEGITGACSDINAIHRIGRLLAQSMLNEWLVGGVLEEVACSVEIDLLQSGKLTSDFARQ